MCQGKTLHTRLQSTPNASRLPVAAPADAVGAVLIISSGRGFGFSSEARSAFGRLGKYRAYGRFRQG